MVQTHVSPPLHPCISSMAPKCNFNASKAAAARGSQSHKLRASKVDGLWASTSFARVIRCFKTRSIASSFKPGPLWKSQFGKVWHQLKRQFIIVSWFEENQFRGGLAQCESPSFTTNQKKELPIFLSTQRTSIFSTGKDLWAKAEPLFSTGFLKDFQRFYI